MPDLGSVLRGRWQVTGRCFSDAWGCAVHEAEDIRVHGRRVLVRQWAAPMRPEVAAMRRTLLQARSGLDQPSLPAWLEFYEEADAWWVVEARVPWPCLPLGCTLPAPEFERFALGLVEALAALHEVGLDADAPAWGDIRRDPDGEAILLPRGSWGRWSWHPLGEGPLGEDSGQLARRDLAVSADLLSELADAPPDGPLAVLLEEMRHAPRPGGAPGACHLDSLGAVRDSISDPRQEALGAVAPSSEPVAAWRLSRPLEELWRVPLVTPVEAVVSLGDGWLGTRDLEGTLTLRRAVDGTAIWHRPYPEPGSGAAGGVVLAGHWCVPFPEHVLALGMETGEPVWSVEVPGLRPRDSLALAGGYLVFAEPLERLFTARDARGKVAWQTSYGRSRMNLDVEALDRLDGKVRWTTGDDLLAWVFKGRMGVLDPMTGKSVWEADVPIGPDGASRQACPVLGEGILALVDRGARSWLFDARTGGPLWAHSGKSETAEPPSRPSVTAGHLVLAASSGQWLALDLGSGSTTWSMYLPGATMAVRPADEILWVQGASGPLLRVEGATGRVLAQADLSADLRGGPWPIGRNLVLVQPGASVLAAFR
ncbi:MAG: PQQ-binding-like beta-propeller repeat protein [Candidatus Sericytochromatia bacterium]|nr:PQQ-binding-like beta-propeller repeat protein [Candidatus Sericytochromatia bacterium]